mgnify:CR=1 FL=1
MVFYINHFFAISHLFWVKILKKEHSKKLFIKTNFTALNTAAGDNGFELLEASEDESNEQSEQSEAEHSE